MFLYMVRGYQNVQVYAASEKCFSIWIAYLYSVRNVYVLAMRARTEVLEDRRGSARNELRESTRLKWFQ